MSKRKNRRPTCQYCGRELLTNSEIQSDTCSRCKGRYSVSISLEQMRGAPDPQYGRREGL